MVSGDLKVLYEINQLLKTKGPYVFVSDISKFICMTPQYKITLDNENFAKCDTSFLSGFFLNVYNGKLFFKFLKDLPKEISSVESLIDHIDKVETTGFNIEETPLCNYSSFISDIAIYGNHTKFKCKEVYLNDKTIPLIDINQIKKLIIEYKLENEHTLLFMDFSCRTKVMQVYNQRKCINYNNDLFLILNINILPMTKVKIKDEKHFGITLFSNNIVEISYGTHIETVKFYAHLYPTLPL